jgi:hypothetical protein
MPASWLVITATPPAQQETMSPLHPTMSSQQMRGGWLAVLDAAVRPSPRLAGGDGGRTRPYPSGYPRTAHSPRGRAPPASRFGTRVRGHRAPVGPGAQSRRSCAGERVAPPLTPAPDAGSCPAPHGTFTSYRQVRASTAVIIVQTLTRSSPPLHHVAGLAPPAACVMAYPRVSLGGPTDLLAASVRTILGVRRGLLAI